MPKMRLGWYAGASTALAASVVLSAFYQRANYYSAMVYLAQSNFCLLVLVNFSFLLYSSFVYGLTRIFYGHLRAIEVEQLTERAWFAITETCLAMTIFREEIGAWFLVMFAALVTGKIWGWIGDGRVEILEQQPPQNPRLFHLRLSVSLALSFMYDVYILRYTINTVIQQARPTMMVMFLFEFAVLATSSWRTAARYALSLTEQNIQESQKRTRLAERRREVREEREAMIRQREAAASNGEEVSSDPLPNEDDVDEMDIEVPGWEAKGEFVLWLDLVTDLVKLGIYIAFFFMLLAFYGLPIHIMRDLFMTSRDFVKRLGALLRYRRAIKEMNSFPDATQEELSREDTCIICREEMHVWDPENNPGTIDRFRPKKLPCGHILHLGCLRGWLERQQMCPTCRTPVSTTDVARGGQNQAAGLRIEIGGGGRPAGQQPAGNGAVGQGQQNGNGVGAQRRGGPRILNLGLLRIGFGANDRQVRELAQEFGLPQDGPAQGAPAPPTPAATINGGAQTVPPTPQPMTGDNLQNLGVLLQQADQLVQREVQSLQVAQQELQTIQLLTAELHRLRQRQQLQEQLPNAASQAVPSPSFAMPQLQFPQPQPHHHHLPPQVAMAQPYGVPSFHTMPARNPSPLMARHGAAPNAIPIPAGSAELPEGVVLPQGWSLLPLHRLDAPAPTQPVSQVGSQASATDNAGAPQSAQAAPRMAFAGSGRSTPQPSENAPPVPPTAEQSAPQPAPVVQPSSPLTRSTEPPNVISPSPRMPNWGGSAQLFGGNSRLDQVEPSSGTGVQPEESSSRPDAAKAAPTLGLTEDSQPSEPSHQTTHSSDSSDTTDSDSDSAAEIASDKGKARAVTVEDAEDDEAKSHHERDGVGSQHNL